VYVGARVEESVDFDRGEREERLVGLDRLCFMIQTPPPPHTGATPRLRQQRNSRRRRKLSMGLSGNPREVTWAEGG